MSRRRTVLSIAAAAAAAAGVPAAVFLGARHDGNWAPAAAATLAAVRVLSVTPGAGQHGVSGTAPIRLRLASAVARGSAMPRVSPAVAGTWHEWGDVLEFDPAAGFAPDTTVTVTVPRASGDMKVSYTTGPYVLLRLQELLGQLGYLPLRWTAGRGGTVTPGDARRQLSAAFAPPAGAFAWARGYPARLGTFWRAGSPNVITTGAVMAFQSAHGMMPTGQVSGRLWSAVLGAAERQQRNRGGYTYAVASKSAPETLTIWHDGRRVFGSYANTGIGIAPTADGTYPVYLRYYYQLMQGANPDGSRYADPVYYVSYFDGGQAVHYFPRYSYGWPQSLGCVELSWDAAQRAWPYLTVGSLVTVTY